MFWILFWCELLWLLLKKKFNIDVIIVFKINFKIVFVKCVEFLGIGINVIKFIYRVVVID